jgi:hypothetical protein
MTTLTNPTKLAAFGSVGLAVAAPSAELGGGVYAAVPDIEI